MLPPLILITGTILAAGIFGGLVNYFLAKPDDVPVPDRNRSIVVGVAASFLVPLFLNMSSSNLIDLIRAGDRSKLLVLLGFCLVASISSTAFIRTLSDRVLSEAKQAKREAREAKEEVENVEEKIQPILSKETESDNGLVLEAAGPGPSSKEQTLLSTLTGGRWALRSQSGLAKETGMGQEEVGLLLQDLAASGFVGRRATPSGTRWFITDVGRRSVEGGRS